MMRSSNLGALIALGLAGALGGGSIPTTKREPQKANPKTMSNRQRDLYEKALRRRARWDKET